MRLLECVNLSRSFGGLVVVNDLSCHVNQGEILGLIGPNGSGKTTTFNLITGFLKPTVGHIFFKGAEITGSMPHQVVQKRIARTWQQSVLFEDMTTLENVILGYHTQRRNSFWGSIFSTGSACREDRKVKQEAVEILKFMGLAPFRDEPAISLSHGHQRSLGIAVALATNPELLLLDEPLTGLNLLEMEASLVRLNKIRERGITILIVEHNMKAVLDVCERIIVLNFGNKIAEGLPQEIKENSDVIEAYLGTEG
jgi:branched-chain amino acid transport system ATP-binding protein